MPRSCGIGDEAIIRQNENPALRVSAKSGVSGTLMYGFLGQRLEGSVRETSGRARGSSGTEKPTGHTFLEASGAHTDWTPRAGGGCPRSLAR